MSRPILYHVTPDVLEGGSYKSPSLDSLTPLESHPGSRAQVFATPDLLCAIAYSLKPNSTQDLIKAHESGQELPAAQLYALQIYTGQKIPPFAVFASKGDAREKFDHHPVGNVLLVENSEFNPMDRTAKTCEWVAEVEVETSPFLRVTSNEAMKFGVQIFLANDPEKFLEEQQKASAELRKNKGVDAVEFWNKFYAAAVNEGWLIHQNQEQNLNPIDLKTGRLANDQFVKDQSLISDRMHQVPSGTVNELVKVFNLKFNQKSAPSDVGQSNNSL